MEEKSNLKRLLTTVGSKNKFIHESTSELHRAISMRDKVWIQALLDKGDTLCAGVDLSPQHGTGTPNCFILAHSVGTSSLMEFLLSLNPQAAITARNNDGLTLLMLFAKEHDIKKVEVMLELGANLDDCCNDGSTALMLSMSKIPVRMYIDSWAYHMEQYRYGSLYKKRNSYGKMCQHFVDLLIQRGADVDICNKNRENALHFAVKNPCTFHLEVIQSLINAGIDPTVETREHCTVLSYAMETLINICLYFRFRDSIAKEVYEAVRFLYKLTPFQQETFQLHCTIEKQPQTILLKHLSCCQIITDQPSIFDDLIASNKNLFNPELMVLVDHIQNMNNQNLNHKLEENVEFPFGLLAVNLNHDRFVDSRTARQMSKYGRKLMENLQYLMSVGFSANIPGTISTLTVGLLHYYPHFDYVEFAKIMLNSGTHVEQRMLKYLGHDQELEQLSAELCLPDALRVALSQSHLTPAVTLELVKMLLPHFAHPGLTLLPFATPRKVSMLFPYLASCGALQHFAQHTTAQHRILNSGCLSEEHLCTFNLMNETVPPLQEMCKTVVRCHLASRASQHGNSLPERIKSIPPLTTVSKNHLVNVAAFFE